MGDVRYCLLGPVSFAWLGAEMWVLGKNVKY